MKRLFRMLTAPVCLASTATSLYAQPLQPTAKWVVDYAEHQCVAGRSYGSPEEPLTLGFKPSPIGDILQLTILRGGLGGAPQQAPIRIGIGSHPPIETKALAFNTGRAKSRLFRVNLPISELDRLAAASTLSIEMAGVMKRSFAISQMKAVAAELTKCVEDLRNHWNIGPENEPKLRLRAAEGEDIRRFFKDEDYPDIAIRNEEEGTVGFAVLVDETGKIADCTLIETSNVPLLDALSCSVLTTRAKVAPAVGVDGMPARDALVSKIKWSLGN